MTPKYKFGATVWILCGAGVEAKAKMAVILGIFQRCKTSGGKIVSGEFLYYFDPKESPRASDWVEEKCVFSSKTSLLKSL